MSDEIPQEGESQIQSDEKVLAEAEALNDDDGNEKDDEEEKDDVVSQPEMEPEEEDEEPQETTAPVSSEPLRDPRTGALLRDQSPGVPNSPWVGKHNPSDVDGAPIKEKVVPESDFGKD